MKQLFLSDTSLAGGRGVDICLSGYAFAQSNEGDASPFVLGVYCEDLGFTSQECLWASISPRG